MSVLWISLALGSTVGLAPGPWFSNWTRYSMRTVQEGRWGGTNLPQSQCQTKITAKANKTNASELASTYRTPWFITPPLASVGVRKIVIGSLLSSAAACA